MRSKFRFLHHTKRFWRTLGPGLITGASDDDPSAITTFSQAGASYGLATLWMVVVVSTPYKLDSFQLADKNGSNDQSSIMKKPLLERLLKSVNRIGFFSLRSNDPNTCEVLTQYLYAASRRPAFLFIRF